MARDRELCDVFHLDPARAVRLRQELMVPDDVASLTDTFKLLGDGTRVRILDALSRDRLCVCDLAGLLDLTESAVSHQLRLLRGLRLVRAERSGRMVFYSLDDRHILTLFQQALRHVREATGPAKASRRAR